MYLKELIEFLEERNPDIVCPLGFSNPDSYRGSYDQLAFAPTENVTVGEMLVDAKSALGTMYYGYKGGEYVMDEYTECWLAKYGYTGESIGEVLLKYMVGDFKERK